MIRRRDLDPDDPHPNWPADGTEVADELARWTWAMVRMMAMPAGRKGERPERWRRAARP